jgi:hypothetical protein
LGYIFIHHPLAKMLNTVARRIMSPQGVCLSINTEWSLEI